MAGACGRSTGGQGGWRLLWYCAGAPDGSVLSRIFQCCFRVLPAAEAAAARASGPPPADPRLTSRSSGYSESSSSMATPAGARAQQQPRRGTGVRGCGLRQHDGPRDAEQQAAPQYPAHLLGPRGCGRCPAAAARWADPCHTLHQRPAAGRARRRRQRGRGGGRAGLRARVACRRAYHEQQVVGDLARGARDSHLDCLLPGGCQRGVLLQGRGTFTW